MSDDLRKRLHETALKEGNAFCADCGKPSQLCQTFHGCLKIFLYYTTLTSCVFYCRA